MRAPSQKLNLTGLFLLFNFFILGQHHEMTWGMIPRSDLSMQIYPPDSSAEAVVLADEGQIRIIAATGSQRTRYYLDRHRRIKLLKRQSFDDYGQGEALFCTQR